MTVFDADNLSAPHTQRDLGLEPAPAVDVSTAPERIWAQRGTLIGDPAENGYWEARNLYSGTMAEYIRADLHAAEIASLTAERDAALAGMARDTGEPAAWIFTHASGSIEAFHDEDVARLAAEDVGREMTVRPVFSARAPITVQAAARVLLDALAVVRAKGWKNCTEAERDIYIMEVPALRAIAEQEGR